jgi:HCOMODA/2-hydroxy-3-carboxy-muconic semialdehyde decarboxylase
MTTRLQGSGAILAAWLTASALVSGQAIPSQTTASASPPTMMQVVDDLIVANRILSHEGIVDGLGHISVRSIDRPDRFWLGRDLAPSLQTAADLVEYDLDGKAVPEAAPVGVSERFIHAAIYKARPDVMAIVHAHTPSVLAFAVSNIPLRPVYHMATFLIGGAIPMFEIRKVPGSVGMLVNSIELGAALAQTLGDRPVALLRGHGFVAVGPSIPEVVSRSIFLDVNARVQAQAMALGGSVNLLTQVDAGPLGGQASAPGQPIVYPRSWWYWKDRAVGR